MRQSESITELAAAMAQAQAEMGGAVKEANNPFFKSKYADLTSVVKAIKEPFASHGLSYVQLPCATELGVGVTTRLMHASGEWLESDYVLPIVKNDPQAAGSAITYARRYALQAMAGIPTADDDAESAMMRVGPEYTSDQKATFDMLVESEDALGFLNFVKTAGESVAVALHNSGEAGKKVALKKAANDLEKSAHVMLDQYAEQVSEALNNGDSHAITLAQEVAESGDWVKNALWGRLTPEQKEQFKQLSTEAAA